MEKLVLRGIMYGADKIPDSWFDKVPGGFFKEKERERQEQRAKDQQKRRSRREKSRRRRHSDDFEDRRPRHEDEDYYEGRDRADDHHRRERDSERRRRHARSRSSYDGSNDYDVRHDDRESKRGRRRTYHEDGDRYGYDDGFLPSHGPRQDEFAQGRRSFASPLSAGPMSPPNAGPSPQPFGNIRDTAVAAAASAGTAAAMAQQARRAPPASAQVPPNYVPYADIYGQSATAPPATAGGARQIFSPPPASAASSVQPNSMNQVSPPVVPPPDATEYPPTSGPYDPRNYANPYQAPFRGYEDPYTPSYTQSRTPSPSLPSTSTPPRRARSERRPPRDKERPRGKSLSRLREHLNFSQQGLGYSAVGAVAGGLVGSGIGKGRLPAAVGAAVGGLGANALGASQRRRDDRRTSEWAQDQDMIARREERLRSRRRAEIDERGNHSE